MEYQEGDTESDIEDEFIEDEFYGDGLKQIKAKQTTPKPKSQVEYCLLLAVLLNVKLMCSS